MNDTAKACLIIAAVLFALGAVIPLIRGGETNWLCGGACFVVISWLIKM
jgi:hypothetical protein